MSNENPKFVCNSEKLKSGGTGFKFNLKYESNVLPAFVVRFEGSVYGYINRCAHMMMELDWDDAEYFDMDGVYLICSNHGALFEPNTGLCVNGPCYGASLTKISVKEVESQVVLDDDQFDVEHTED